MGNEPEAGEPYWAGFDSPEAFFDHIEAERAKVQFHLEPRKRRIPALDLLADPSAAELPVLARRQAVVRQVGVMHDMFVQAAELHGVAPSTLARMLVRRGAQAILDRDGRERGGGAD